MPTPLRSLVSMRSPIYASRLYSRRRLDLRARLLARPAAGGHVIVVHGRTVDLSRSGAGVTLTRELASGTEVVLCLRLPGSGNALCLHAVITRRQGFRVGLEFVQPTAEQRLLLSELCYA
jgi:PilZ domain